MALFILAVVLFVIADILLRITLKKMKEKKLRQEREAALAVGLKLDFSREAKTLKRAEVPNPKARILCVDDEAVILDSFRRILVLDGYAIDTVETGQEALGLIQQHHYDFVFTDLRMPSMAGEEVAKAVKHLRPDIDVIIITGYATVESAVECMKHGAMDYVQKPFTEGELVELVKKFVFRRQERIKNELRPRVHVSHVAEVDSFPSEEFAIPGGAFISEGHCWLMMEPDGSVKVGIDDFAKKLLGRVDDIEFPNLGMNVKAGQSLFSIRCGRRVIPFQAPISGRVTKVNKYLSEHLEALDITPYGKNWVCVVDAEDFDAELPRLKIGKTAVNFFQTEIDELLESVGHRPNGGNGGNGSGKGDALYPGQLESLEDRQWNILVSRFFRR